MPMIAMPRRKLSWMRNASGCVRSIRPASSGARYDPIISTMKINAVLRGHSVTALTPTMLNTSVRKNGD